jgi:hypothetical protein
MSYEIHKIKLAHIEVNYEGIKFVEAQWWDQESPLVVVLCSHRGDMTKLRMDIDKIAFLDHLADPREDKAIRELTVPVWETVARERGF